MYDGNLPAVKSNEKAFLSGKIQWKGFLPGKLKWKRLSGKSNEKDPSWNFL